MNSIEVQMRLLVVAFAMITLLAPLSAVAPARAEDAIVALQIQDDSGVISMGERFDVNISRTANGGVAVNTDMDVTGTVRAGAVNTAGDVISDRVQTGSVTATSVNAGSGPLSAGAVTAASVTTNGGPIAAGAITASSVDAGVGNIVTGGNVTADSVTAHGAVSARSISAQTIAGGGVTATSVVASSSVSTASVTASGAVTSGSVTSGPITATSLNAGAGNIITNGNVTAERVTARGMVGGSNVYTGPIALAVPSSYASVTAALAVLAGKLLSYAVTITVADGVYSVPEINLSTKLYPSLHLIRLIGNVGTPASCELSLSAGNAVISIDGTDAAGLEVSGFRLRGNFHYALQLTNGAVLRSQSGSMEIRDCVIGVHVSGQSSINLQYAVYANNQNGIIVMENSLGLITGSTFTGPGSGYAVAAYYGSHVVFLSGSITGYSSGVTCTGRGVVDTTYQVVYTSGTVSENCPASALYNGPTDLIVPTMFSSLLAAWTFLQSKVLTFPVTITLFTGVYPNQPNLIYSNQPYASFITIRGSGAVELDQVAGGSTVMFNIDCDGLTISGLTLKAATSGVGYAVYANSRRITLANVVFQNFFTAVRAENAAQITGSSLTMSTCSIAYFAIKMSFINSGGAIAGGSASINTAIYSQVNSHIALTGSLSAYLTPASCDATSTVDISSVSTSSIGGPSQCSASGLYVPGASVFGTTYNTFARGGSMTSIALAGACLALGGSYVTSTTIPTTCDTQCKNINPAATCNTLWIVQAFDGTDVPVYRPGTGNGACLSTVKLDVGEVAKMCCCNSGQWAYILQ